MSQEKTIYINPYIQNSNSYDCICFSNYNNNDNNNNDYFCCFQ